MRQNEEASHVVANPGSDRNYSSRSPVPGVHLKAQDESRPAKGTSRLEGRRLGRTAAPERMTCGRQSTGEGRCRQGQDIDCRQGEIQEEQRPAASRIRCRDSSTSEPEYELATFGGRVFLARRGGFRAAQRGGLGRLGLCRRAMSGIPNYEMVHEGFTGHAEVVMVQYDPDIISYEDLLKVFWQMPRPDHAQPAGARRRHPVSLDHPLPQRRRRKRRP